MLATLAKLLPLAVGGAFLPTWTSYVVLLLKTDRPIANSSAYVAGSTAWRVVLGFAAVFVASVSVPESRLETLSVPVPVAWALAGLLVAGGVWLIVRHRRSAHAQVARLAGWIDRLKRVPPWAAFGYGAYNCATPGTQWVYFLGGCAVIASSDLTWPSQVVLLAAFMAVLDVMLVVPIFIYARRREEAEAVFSRLDEWVSAHAASVFGGILIMLGLLSAYIAMTGGRIGD